MEIQSLSLRTGRELQLVIAAAQDLPSILRPLRARRAVRNAKLAAGMGGATSAVVGGALWAAHLGFWASLGVALGLGTVPLVVTLAGAGIALGLPRGREEGEEEYRRRRAQVELAFCCFQLMAEADGRISEEERLLLRAVLLQYPLTDEDRQAIVSGPVEATLDRAADMNVRIRRQVLQGAWMLAEADGLTAEEETLFGDMADRLGLREEITPLKRQSRALQAGLNSLVTAMFQTCQLVLEPALGQPAASEFLEALAQIAATPQVRRSLRNSLSSGYSAGGVARLLDEHPEAAKLVAQASNAVCAVHGADEQARKAGRDNLLSLAGNSSLGRGESRRIFADIETLLSEAAGAAGEQQA